MNSPTPIAALTNGIAAVFVPLRSVRLFVLATLAICAAGVMWIACNQSKPSVSAECSQDVQYHWWAESYFQVGEFDYAESMLRKCIAVHSSFGCSHCVSQVQDKRYLAQDVLISQANPTPCRLHKNCEHDVEVEARGLFGH